MNMKICSRLNVKKHSEIKDGDKYITFEILLKFGSLYKMVITSSEPKDYLGRSGKGWINSLGIKTNVRSNKNKNSWYAITNVSMKYLSKIIKEFEKLPYKGYVWKRLKNEPTDSYSYLAIHISKCMMRSNALNYHVGPVGTEITGTQHIPISRVCDSDKMESK